MLVLVVEVDVVEVEVVLRLVEVVEVEVVLRLVLVVELEVVEIEVEVVEVESEVDVVDVLVEIEVEVLRLVLVVDRLVLVVEVEVVELEVDVVELEVLVVVPCSQPKLANSPMSSSHVEGGYDVHCAGRRYHANLAAEDAQPLDTAGQVYRRPDECFSIGAGGAIVDDLPLYHASCIIAWHQRTRNVERAVEPIFYPSHI